MSTYKVNIEGNSEVFTFTNTVNPTETFSDQPAARIIHRVTSSGRILIRVANNTSNGAAYGRRSGYLFSELIKPDDTLFSSLGEVQNWFRDNTGKSKGSSVGGTTTQTDTDSFLFTNENAKGELWSRFTYGYNPGAGFADDIGNTAADVLSFTADPDQYRPVFGASQSMPSNGQNLHTSAFQAYALDDVTLANLIVTEIFGTVNANDLTTTYWTTSGSIRWDATDDLWIQCAKIKKLKDSYDLLKNLQTILGAADKSTIESWFSTFFGYAYAAVKTRTETYLGADWHLNGISTFNPENVYPGGGNIENPIQDASGNDLTDYTVSWAQDLFNNRNWDIIGAVHSYAVTTNDYEKEFWAREWFKIYFKYGVFPNGITWEMIRATDADPTLGVFYTFISLGAATMMAHLDAQANHYPNDRLYDYTTIEGITNGSTTYTTSGYAGGSTTDGSTPKGLLSTLKAQSNFLRSTANGGWNDQFYFENSSGTEIPLDITGARQPSSIPALANLYYRDQELLDWYTYNTGVGYPAKVTISEGYLAGVGNEDQGPWGNLVMGSIWFGLEESFFEYKNGSVAGAGDSPFTEVASEQIRFTNGTSYVEMETVGSPALRVISGNNDFPTIQLGNTSRTFRIEIDSNGRFYIKDNTTNNDAITIFNGVGDDLLKLYSSNVGINISGLPAHALDVDGTVQATQFKVTGLGTAPVSATAPGELGDIVWTATHIYFCIATNTWVRTALSTW